jgi:hypothetical protein
MIAVVGRLGWSLERGLTGGEPCLKINNHGFDHGEDFRDTCELPIFAEDGEALHAVEDDWVTAAKGFREQVACELNDDVSR